MDAALAFAADLFETTSAEHAANMYAKHAAEFGAARFDRLAATIQMLTSYYGLGQDEAMDLVMDRLVARTERVAMAA
jgi:hypothetical protein